MPFRSIMTAVTFTKLLVSIGLYFGFLLQIVLQISAKFDLIKNLFSNVFNPSKYDLRQDVFVTPDSSFLIQLTSFLLAADRLSTCILQDLKTNQISNYIGTAIASINNVTYLFKCAVIISILIFLIRRTIAYKRNGDIIKALRNIGWIICCLGLVILHLLDPSSDYLIGHWKN